MTRVKFDRKNKFWSKFDTKTGLYIRSGILENGKDTGVDPYMTDYPELLDIGIMGSCAHGLSGLCLQSGVGCYQDGHAIQPHMALEDFKSIIDQSKDYTFQAALGGRGDPNKHPNFKEIVAYARENGVVPNYTTSGLALTDKEIAITKEYCGAVAVSWYRSNYTLQAIKRFNQAGCTTNIHYVLGNQSIDEAIDRLNRDDFPDGINAVIFLLHKPVGEGTYEDVLSFYDPRVKQFFEMVDRGPRKFKIGFDSCTVPGILNFSKRIHPDSVEACDAGRYSMYISPDMKAMTCSFDNQGQKWAVSLRDMTIQEAWHSPAFKRFRSHSESNCGSCSTRGGCYGGCPITPEITLCERPTRTSHGDSRGTTVKLTIRGATT